MAAARAAEVAVACACINLFKLCLTQTQRDALKNVTRWFYTCVNQPQFRKVVGVVSEAAAAGPATRRTRRGWCAMSAEPVRAALGLGANLGDPAAAMARALRMLDDGEDTAVAAVSKLYRTPPWGLVASSPGSLASSS